MKTELEKCLAGEPFYGGDPEIVKIAAKAKRLTRELNDTGYTVLPQFCWMAFQQHKIEHIEFFF